MTWPSRAVAGAVAVGALVALALPSPTAASSRQALPVPVTAPDPDLARDLDAALALAPPDTCLTVVADGVTAYDRRGSDPQTPASTQKLLTSLAALDALDPSTSLRTEVVAAGPVRDGVVEGDLVLVGGGDPALTTDRLRTVTGIAPSRPTTRFDDLVDQLVAAGIREVRGRIVVDDRRYDAQRTVPSWPDRYVAQGQAGPLGALVVDDGFLLVPDDDGTPRRVRADDPAIAAGGTLQVLLATRGIATSSLPVAGERPEPATVLASVASPPLGDLVADLLLRSDNHAAELLLKELGVAVGGEGSTAAGARAVAAWTTGNGAASPGARVIDGSGLDPENQTTCRDLVAALDLADPDGPIAQGLPVAGRTGTLARRLGSTAAAGVLRAKTGSLNGVSALAGFVALPEGGSATFAFIANGDVPRTDIDRVEALVAELLARWEPPCPEAARAAVASRPVLTPLGLGVAPGTGALGSTVAATATLLAADVERPALDRCSLEVQVALDLGIG